MENGGKGQKVYRKRIGMGRWSGSLRGGDEFLMG